MPDEEAAASMDGAQRLKQAFEDNLRAICDIFAQEPGVVAAYLHGSYAEGWPTPLSDLDFAVLLTAEAAAKGWEVELRLQGAISRLLNSDEVDLKGLNGAPLVFQMLVITRGKLLYVRDDDARVWWEVRALGEWMDFQPLHDLQDECMLRRIEEGTFGHGRQSR